jgi:mono/diheme cytochrome c family protein
MTAIVPIPPSRITLLLAALVACSLGAAACSGSGSGARKADEPVDLDKGRQLFQTNCRVCHALADAKAAGTFGPDLDLLQPDAERVREQIDEGGGGMPQDIIEGEDADLVAQYVAEVAGQGLETEGEGGSRGATKPGEDG